MNPEEISLPAAEAENNIADTPGVRRRGIERSTRYSDLSRHPIYEEHSPSGSTTAPSTRRAAEHGLTPFRGLFPFWNDVTIDPLLERSASLINQFEMSKTPSLSEHSNYKHSKWGEDEYDDIHVSTELIDLSFFEMSGVFLVFSHWKRRVLAFLSSWFNVFKNSRYVVYWQSFSLETLLSESIINMWTSLIVIITEVKSFFFQPFSALRAKGETVSAFLHRMTSKRKLEQPCEYEVRTEHLKNDSDLFEEPESDMAYFRELLDLLKSLFVWLFPFLNRVLVPTARN